ncbi:hypothetical protein B0H63DRAFT_51392 [Podospora didyma]|uniref:Hemerythrin-like domain-containing protein n=1 Tax=Podospora didyma TaxID=330526 RepID=A0AAE0P7U6_9PEZI|nr:hypothetical protein B0H63DRAFT_51392 [Podospora didyma]
MASPLASPPKYTDTPLAVIHTPTYQTRQTDPFTAEASRMALSHNSFIRGFNSIYQQAPRVPLVDKPDFVFYAIAWHDCLDLHHHFEETDLFPAIDAAAGKKGLMGEAVAEHAAFHGGMERFKAYLQAEGGNFSGTELVAIMDSFKDALYAHLQSEPAALVALAEHSTPERPIDILAIAGAAATKQLNLNFIFNIMPVFLLNMDTVDFEDGMWDSVFPPFPYPVKLVFTRLVPLWQGNRKWRFASCSVDGRAKQLAF